MLYQAFSVAMALLLLASTTSWMVGKHYCMGLLMDVALFEHAEDCGMDMEGKEADTIVSREDGCCNDEVIAIPGQDDLKISFDDLNLEQQVFLVAFTHSYYNFSQFDTERLVPNEYYPPPLLVKDIQLLDEVFLI